MHTSVEIYIRKLGFRNDDTDSGKVLRDLSMYQRETHHTTITQLLLSVPFFGRAVSISSDLLPNRMESLPIHACLQPNLLFRLTSYERKRVWYENMVNIR